MKTIRIMAIFMLFTSLACFNALAANTLKIGITPNMPPLIYKEAGQYAGLEAALAQKLGEELGRDIEFIEVDWTDQIPALVEGRTDIIMSSMTITQKRNMQISFSEPYFIIGQMGLVRIKDQSLYLTIPYLKSIKTRIGVEKGTTGEMLLHSMMPERKLSTYTTPQEGVDALKKKRIDLFIHDSPIIWSVLAKDYANEFAVANGTLSTEYLGWGMRKNDEELLSDVNTVLRKWKTDGTLEAAVKKWMPFIETLGSKM